MKKLFLVIVCVLFILNGCTNNNSEKSDQTTPVITEVETSRAIEATGKIKGMVVKDVCIDFPAVVEKINVKEGQKVKQGDLILTLDIRDYEKQIENKELELNMNVLQLQDIEKSIGAEESDLVRLQQELEKKKAYLKNNNDPDMLKLASDLENAKKQYNKALNDLAQKQDLYKNWAISEKELKDFEDEVDRSEKAVNDIKLSIENLKDRKQAEINELQSSINYKKAQLSDKSGSGVNRIDIQKLKNDMLRNTVDMMKDKMKRSFIDSNRIVSDVKNGLIYTVDCSEGSMVGQNGMASKLFSIMDLDSVVVEADVPEEFIKDVEVDDKVEIVPLSDRMKRYNGKVRVISNRAFQKNGETNVKVEISIDNPDDFLKPDFNVDVVILPE